MLRTRAAARVARASATGAQARAMTGAVSGRVSAPARAAPSAMRAPGLAAWGGVRAVQARACTTINCPAIAESISEGTVGEWKVQVGDEIEEDGILGEIESDKAVAPIRAPHDGVVTEILIEEGVTVNVGDPIIKMKAGAVSAASAADEAPAAPAAPAADAAPATPAAPAKTPAAPAATKPKPKPKAELVASTDREKRVRLTPMRKRIADRLKASQNTAAMLTTFQEVDMTNIMAMRNEHKEEFAAKHGVKLGFMSAFVKASAEALKAVPIINAYMDTENDAIVYHDYVDISVAVAIPTGLVVPVLRDVQDMNFADIEKSIGAYAEKAKAGELSIAEMSGGTFTISNGGTYGSWMGTPIINPPQSAVLGMHAVKQKPWVTKDGKIEARPIMALALTYDHRLIDGRDAVTFLVKVRNLIEDPQRLVLDLA